MSGLAGWFGARDPTRHAARKYASLVARFRRKFPDRPLKECLRGMFPSLMRKMLPEGTYERTRLEAILSPELPCDDPVEFCCRLVTFETGIMPEDELLYLAQAECVQAELARVGLQTRSDWLMKLRSSVAEAKRSGRISSVLPPAGDGPAILTIPSDPDGGNWTGLTLFALIAIPCAYFGHRTAAVILLLVGLASFLTPVTYWELDKRHGRLGLRRCSGLHTSAHVVGYALREIMAVELESRTDDEGTNYIVRLVMANGRTIMVSDHKREADRVAAFLGVEKRMLTK
jgi:hypothetical protein